MSIIGNQAMNQLAAQPTKVVSSEQQTSIVVVHASILEVS
jgi:hypothetical protein